MFRVLYGMLCGDLCGLAVSENFIQATEALCEHDCKSLTDALLVAGGAATKTSEDKRLRIELSMISDACPATRHASNGSREPTDVLTKGKQRDHVELLRKLLHTARYQIPCHLRDVGGKTASS